MKDKLGVKGRLVVELTSGGTLKKRIEVDNLVVNDGKAFIISRMANATASVMSHMAVGTGTTAPAPANTALQTQVARVALTSTNVSGNEIEYKATFPPGTGTGALTEAGIFNASSSGTMLARTTFAVINKAASDQLAITWTVEVN